MFTSWWLLAFISSITASLDIGLNRYFKREALPLTLVTFAFQFVLLSPFLFFVPLSWPLVVTGVLWGMALGVMDVFIFNAARTISGAVISQVMSLRIWVLFLIWGVFDYRQTLFLIADPRFYGVLALMLLASISFFWMRRCEISRKGLIMVLPAMLASVFCGFIVKFMFIRFGYETGPFHTLACISIVGLSGSFICLLGMFSKFRPKVELKWKSFLWPMVIMGASMIVTVALRFNAFIASPNPAYVHMIAMLSAVWLYIIGRVLGLDEKLNPWAGFGLVASAAGLIYLTA